MFPSINNNDPSFSIIDDSNGNNQAHEKNHAEIRQYCNKENVSNSLKSSIKNGSDEMDGGRFVKINYHGNVQPTKDVIGSYGGVLGTLGSPKLTKKKKGRRNTNNNDTNEPSNQSLRKGRMEGIKLPPIEHHGKLQNLVNSNRESDSESILNIDSFRCISKYNNHHVDNDERSENSAPSREHHICLKKKTPLKKSIQTNFLSPVSKCMSIDESSTVSHFDLEKVVPSHITNSPFSIVSHLETPTMKASITSSYYDTNHSNLDVDETDHDEDTTSRTTSSRVESVSAVEVDDSKCHSSTTNQSASSSEISVYIPRYGKMSNKLAVDDTIDDDYNSDDSLEDDDVDYVENEMDDNYSYRGSTDTDDSDSKTGIVDESFYGKTISMHPDQIDCSFNENSRNCEIEQTFLNSSTVHSNTICSDTESEASDDELSTSKLQTSSRNELKSYKEKIIDITSTTASLTFSTVKEEKSLLINLSSNGENDTLEVTILADSLEQENDNLDRESSRTSNISFPEDKMQTKSVATEDKSLSSSTHRSSKKKLENNTDDALHKMKRTSKEGKDEKIKWTLGPKIGVGTFGVVHMGMNTRTGKLMAVKKLSIPFKSMISTSQNKNMLEDLQDEIELMKSLDHINIVRYIGSEVNVQKNRIFIFQEWIPGGSVAALLHKFGPFSIRVIKTYLTQILNGLEYLHSCRILHRDIKGGNILINDDGVVKVRKFIIM